MNTDQDELKTRLSAEQYHVTQEAGTEQPFTGIYHDTKDDGNVSLHRLRRRVVRLGGQIRFRHGMAEFLAAQLRRCRQHEVRRDPRHETYRGRVCQLWGAPGPRVPGRSSPHRRPVLHELGFPATRTFRALATHRSVNFWVAMRSLGDLSDVHHQ